LPDNDLREDLILSKQYLSSNTPWISTLNNAGCLILPQFLLYITQY
jgi:hypothetical protein